jgi:NADH-quinone oxidoreductase subunit G
MDDSLGANIWADYADGIIYRIMPRCNPEANKSWLSNAARDAAQKVHENRLLGGDISAASNLIKETKGKIAIVLGGSCTMEEIAAFKKLEGKAEFFGGSFLPPQKADGIARSGDPVANRAGLEKAGFCTDLSKLAKRAGEFELLITVAADLWDETPQEASGLDSISKHIALSPFNGSTAKKATIAIGIPHWLEKSGTMINCKGTEQKLQAVHTNEAAQCPALNIS